MRPRELTLQGFRSYRTPATFDFRGRRLVGIVGPIGAGKSSILDGIVFALYGKTPAIERDTSTLIHQRADSAHVGFTFEVGGQIWRAQRGLRRKGQPGHKLERLATDEPGAEVMESVDGKKGTQDKVAELLGMDFDAFCRSVLLAQNRFADFLKATSGNRDAVLKGVFDYERFDSALQRTKLHVAEANGRLVGFEDEGTRLAQAREALPAARADAVAAARVATAFEDARPEIESLSAAMATAIHDATAAQARLDVLERAASSAPPRDEVSAAVDAAVAAVDAERDATAARDAAETAVAEAQAARDECAASEEEMRAFEELVKTKELQALAVVEATERRDATIAERDGSEEALAEVTEEVVRTEAALAEAEETLAVAIARTASAQVALDGAKHAEMAVELRAHLETGQTCPVCAQTVSTLPPAGKAPATRSAEKTLRAARAAQEAATVERDTHGRSLAACRERAFAADVRLARAVADVATAEDALTSAHEALALTKDRIVRRLGDGSDPIAAIEAMRRALEEAETTLRAAVSTANQMRAAVDDARRRVTDASSEVATLGAKIAGTWGLLGDPREPATDPDAIRASSEELLHAVRARTTEAEDLARTARSALEDATAGLTARLTELGLAPDADFTRALADAAARSATCDAKLAELQATIDEGADLDARIAEATQTRDLAQRLANDLQPSRFLRWALAEERRALADLGSLHFEELTDGAYRFTDDDRFDVVDVNAAGRERPADSLSGGETFLASLALALALAEMVARGGGRLDSFFLDEGFGSLDPEHLDRAMDGIARLVAGDSDRLVVLVSHVDQMRETLEDLIVLDKDPRTGDTIVLSGASVAV